MGVAMARRRKSLIAQIFTDAQKARAARERENRRVQVQMQKEEQARQRAYEKALADQERQAAQREREAERQAVARAKEADQEAAQARRAREQAKAAADKQERQAAAEQHRKEQAAQRAANAEAARLRRDATEAAKAERERAKAEKEAVKAALEGSVAQQNEELNARLAQLAGLLSSRERHSGIASLELERILSRDGVEAFCALIEQSLSGAAYPTGVPADLKVLGYLPEARELIIERELPRDGTIPSESVFKLVKGEVRPVARKPADQRHLYGQLLARTALRTLAETFAAAPPTLVDSIVLNGRVTAVDRSTGKIINPHLLSVQFMRSAFDELVLDSPELDPELCLRAQNALISPHPHDLVPVKPLLYYDLDRFKIIAGIDLLVDLDSRLDLLTLTPNEFETLIRQLFEARGLTSWQTQASRDEGVDAVAVNEDPVLGGLAIIQAKRYAKIVGYESVTALAGVMQDKAAAKGILVTTSWVGKASRDFANRNGRIQIIEGRELKHMLAESLNMDVLISLPVIPPGWQREEIA
jgi:restriction system protein